MMSFGCQLPALPGAAAPRGAGRAGRGRVGAYRSSDPPGTAGPRCSRAHHWASPGPGPAARQPECPGPADQIRSRVSDDRTESRLGPYRTVTGHWHPGPGGARVYGPIRLSDRTVIMRPGRADAARIRLCQHTTAAWQAEPSTTVSR
eukprot:691903-Hanusia_phi.AAC.2